VSHTFGAIGNTGAHNLIDRVGISLVGAWASLPDVGSERTVCLVAVDVEARVTEIKVVDVVQTVLAIIRKWRQVQGRSL
jgi:hypothetical protein